MQLPAPLVQRYEPGVSLGLDLLSDLEAFTCATHSEDTCARTFDALAPFDARAFECTEQLDALEQDHRFTHPTSHNERIRYQDNVRHVVATPGPVTGFPVVWELVRFPVEQWGAAVIERFEISAWATPLDLEGEPVGPRALVGGSLIAPDPCPFPLAHPQGLAPLVLVFLIQNQRLPNRGGVPLPPFITNGQPQEVPIVPTLLGPVIDMRYQWGSTGGIRHHWIARGLSILRAFTLIVSGAQFWRVEFCTRISGYTQAAGRNAAALRSVIVRS